MKTRYLSKLITLTLFLLLQINPVLADQSQSINTQKDFEHHTVRYSVFNSTFVTEEVARAYGLKRSAYESLLNVSVSPKNEYGSYPAKVSGTVTNLLQQQKILEFIEISEKDATYYIAPITINGEENVHIDLNIQPSDSEHELQFKFTQKLYSDK